MAPTMSQTANSQNGEPRDLAIPAGVRKMPTAMASPATAAAAEPRPNSRLLAASFIGAEGIAAFRESDDPPQNLFLRRLRFDLVDHDGFGTSALVDLAGHNDFFRGKRKKLGVLSARWRGGGDGPVDGAVFGEDDELRACIGASGRTLFADRF